jgi:zinc transport system substrate-binding protein
MSPRAAAVLLAAVLGVTACGDAAPPASPAGAPAAAGQEQLSVAAAFYPLEFALRRVGGERVAVEGLTPPGAEPHDLELGARQTARVVDADLLVHLEGFQPAVDELAEQVGDKAFDVTSVVELREGYEELNQEEGEQHEGEQHEGEQHEGEQHESEEHAGDPHVWLDPTLLAQIGDGLAQRLAELDPEGAEDYRAGARALRADLEELDASYREGLTGCERREIVVSHNAFGYLAARYDLEQVGISGLSPEEEPAPARIAEAAEYARQHGVTTIFFETLVSPAVAETVATEVGSSTAVLDPIEGQPEGGDYLSGMRANLDALRAALGCR